MGWILTGWLAALVLGGLALELRRRLELAARELSSVALLLLPAFALAHALLSPQTRHAVAWTHLSLLLVCLTVREMAPRLGGLDSLRGLMATAYSLLFAGAAIVCAQISAEGVEAPLASHLAALCFFILIAASVLALPVSPLDRAAVSVGVLPSMAFAICSAPRALWPLYLLCFACTLAIVGRLAQRKAAQRETRRGLDVEE